MNWGAALLLLLREAAIMGTQRLRAVPPEWECSCSQNCPSKALAQEAF